MNDKKNTDLGSGSIGKLLFKLSLPAIIAQLVNVLYNIVDRMFIGRLDNGDLAMAGIGVAFPIITLISAFSALIGNGGAPIAAIKMGKKDNDGAEKILGNSFSMLIIISIILTIGFSIFKEPILMAFGASEATIGYATGYLGIYLLGNNICSIISWYKSIYKYSRICKVWYDNGYDWCCNKHSFRSNLYIWIRYGC